MPFAPFGWHEQADQRQSELLQDRRARACRGAWRSDHSQEAEAAAQPQTGPGQVSTIEEKMTIADVRRGFALSERALEFPASPIRKLAPLAEAAKRRGIKVYHLNIGQPDIETPACMRDRLKNMNAHVLEYSPSAGTPEYLQSLQHYYERHI